MEFLKEWVRGLATLVVLAGCLELMVPSGSMKKYVRLTMGLLVMLSITRPVLGVLGHPLPADVAVFQSDSRRSLPGLGEIMAQAEQFREKNQAFAVDEVSRRLEQEAEAAARGVKGVADARASVALRRAGNDLVVTEVVVAVTSGTNLIRPIAPIRIGSKSSTPAPTPAPTAAEQQLADSVRREVAERLGIRADAQTIQVKVGRESLAPGRDGP